MGHPPAQSACCVMVPMPSALSSLSSRSWPENGRFYCQLPSKKCRKHHHHTRIPPPWSGCHPSCRFSEWGVPLLGNNIHAKAQTRQKIQLQSPGGPRRRILCPVVVYINLLVRKLAGGMCWFCVCAALYDKIGGQVGRPVGSPNWQFAKVPPPFF